MPLEAGCIAVGGHFVLGMTWPEAFLVGAILSPTDPTLVGELLRREAVPVHLLGWRGARSSEAADFRSLQQLLATGAARFAFALIGAVGGPPARLALALVNGGLTRGEWFAAACSVKGGRRAVFQPALSAAS
jgi:hypothetical protein